MKGKVARGIGVLKKAKPYFTQETLKTLYNSFVYPYFTYCIEVWGNVYSSHLEPLYKLQKWAIRIITCTKKRDHTSPLFHKLQLLKLNEIYVYFTTLLMYKYHHNFIPQVMQNLFIRNNAVHDYSTRQHNVLHVPISRSNLSSRNIRVTGVTLYNHFYRILNWDVFYVTFKYNLKRYLLENDITSLL